MLTMAAAPLFLYRRDIYEHSIFSRCCLHYRRTSGTR